MERSENTRTKPLRTNIEVLEARRLLSAGGHGHGHGHDGDAPGLVLPLTVAPVVPPAILTVLPDGSVSLPPVAPTAVALTPVAPVPVAPTAVAPAPVTPTAAAPVPVAPTAAAPAPVAPTPVVLTPVADVTNAVTDPTVPASVDTTQDGSQTTTDPATDPIAAVNDTPPVDSTTPPTDTIDPVATIGEDTSGGDVNGSVDGTIDGTVDDTSTPIADTTDGTTPIVDVTSDVPVVDPTTTIEPLIDTTTDPIADATTDPSLSDTTDVLPTGDGGDVLATDDTTGIGSDDVGDSTNVSDSTDTTADASTDDTSMADASDTSLLDQTINAATSNPFSNDAVGDTLDSPLGSSNDSSSNSSSTSSDSIASNSHNDSDHEMGHVQTSRPTRSSWDDNGGDNSQLSHATVVHQVERAMQQIYSQQQDSVPVVSTTVAQSVSSTASFAPVTSNDSTSATVTETHKSVAHRADAASSDAAPAVAGQSSIAAPVASATPSATPAPVASNSSHTNELVEVQTIAAATDSAVASTNASTMAWLLGNMKYGRIAGGGTDDGADVQASAATPTFRRVVFGAELVGENIQADLAAQAQIAIAQIAPETTTMASSLGEVVQAEVPPPAVGVAVAGYNARTQLSATGSSNMWAVLAAGTAVFAVQFHQWRKRKVAAAANKLAGLLQFDPLAVWIDDLRGRR